MSINDMSFKIAGEAGQGIESSGAGFAQALARGGLHIFAMQDYMSRIRGGHNFFQIRVAPHDIYSHTDEVHLLLAMNKQAAEEHRAETEEGYDRRDKTAAWELARLWGERIPIGVLYQEERPIYEDQEIALQAGPLVKREPKELTREQVGALKHEFI